MKKIAIVLFATIALTSCGGSSTEGTTPAADSCQTVCADTCKKVCTDSTASAASIESTSVEASAK